MKGQPGERNGVSRLLISGKKKASGQLEKEKGRTLKTVDDVISEAVFLGGRRLKGGFVPTVREKASTRTARQSGFGEGGGGKVRRREKKKKEKARRTIAEKACVRALPEEKKDNSLPKKNLAAPKPSGGKIFPQRRTRRIKGEDFLSSQENHLSRRV